MIKLNLIPLKKFVTFSDNLCYIMWMEIEKIYEKYKRVLMNITIRIVQNENDAEDILQTAFLRLAQRHIENEKQAFSYLVKTVVGRAKNRRYRKRPSDDNDPEIVVLSPEQSMLSQELKEMIKQAVEKLPYKERIILIMKKYEGFSHKEISDILNIKEGTVRVLLYRAIKKLEKILLPYIKEGKE